MVGENRRVKSLILSLLSRRSEAFLCVGRPAFAALVHRGFLISKSGEAFVSQFEWYREYRFIPVSKQYGLWGVFLFFSNDGNEE